MKLIHGSLTFFTLMLLLSSAGPLAAQVASPGTFKVGDRVQIEYVPDSDKWLAGTIREVLDDGYRYSVDIVPGQAAAEARIIIHFRRVRQAPTGPAAPRPSESLPAHAIMGKYRCTESRYNAAAGGYVFDAKGSVVLMPDGRYQYLGFTRPSVGRYEIEGRTGKVRFAAGYLRGGEATPMAEQPGRFYLTAPAIGSRWTCGRQG